MRRAQLILLGLLLTGCAGHPDRPHAGAADPPVKQAALAIGSVVIAPLVLAFYVLAPEETQTIGVDPEKRYYELATEEIYRLRWETGHNCAGWRYPVYPAHCPASGP